MGVPELARGLGISEHAAALYLDSDVVDLHLDTFIWRRLFGYRLGKRHGHGPFGARFFGQADIPRVLEAGLTGAYWIITTNPLRTSAGRDRALRANVAQLRADLAAHPGVRLVSTLSEYRAARGMGEHAAFLGVQGGNAIDASPTAAHDALAHAAAQGVSLVTLLHFTRSRIGAPQLPAAVSAEAGGLQPFGRELVARMNHARVIVDLSHLHTQGFWDVVEAHDKSLPFVVSHAASAHVRPHFRNLDDDQLRAVARCGGVVGIIFNAGFLGNSWLNAHVDDVVNHLAHMASVIGEDHLALGSDFDGLIVPPRDMRTVLELPRLVEGLLRRGFSERFVRKVLAENFLRVLGAVRP